MSSWCHWRNRKIFARSQVGQPHAFRIPTWAKRSDRRMGAPKCPEQIIQEHILLRKDRSIRLRRFNAMAKIEFIKRKRGRASQRTLAPKLDFGGPSQRSGRTSALPYPLLGTEKNTFQKTTCPKNTHKLLTAKFFHRSGTRAPGFFKKILFLMSGGEHQREFSG